MSDINILTSKVSKKVILRPSNPSISSRYMPCFISKDLLGKWIKRQTDDRDDTANRSKRPSKQEILLTAYMDRERLWNSLYTYGKQHL